MGRESPGIAPSYAKYCNAGKEGVSPLLCELLFALLVELVLVTPIANYLRLQNAVGLWRILLMLGRATLEVT